VGAQGKLRLWMAAPRANAPWACLFGNARAIREIKGAFAQINAVVKAPNP
jgi:hypothetical protein